MEETRKVFDPFLSEEVNISDKLTDRLRGKYACGPHLPNGNPEFGWRQFQSPPIQHEAADHIEKLNRLLWMRDSFIVDKGLWLDFVKYLKEQNVEIS
jgi:hypothetical protein